jgi:hypothetical protein
MLYSLAVFISWVVACAGFLLYAHLSERPWPGVSDYYDPLRITTLVFLATALIIGGIGALIVGRRIESSGGLATAVLLGLFVGVLAAIVWVAAVTGEIGLSTLAHPGTRPYELLCIGAGVLTGLTWRLLSVALKD